jgi:hypothetical protein
VRFETMLAVVVREDLAAWQKLNVTAPRSLVPRLTARSRPDS